MFQGIGKLKEFQLHLHVHPNVPPFALREKVAKGRCHRASRSPYYVGVSRCTQALRRNKSLRGHASRFMGILLSRHGVGPTEVNVRAMKEDSHPTTPSEVMSFLGFVWIQLQVFQTLPLSQIA